MKETIEYLSDGKTRDENFENVVRVLEGCSIKSDGCDECRDLNACRRCFDLYIVKEDYK